MGDDGTPGATWNPLRGCSRVSEGCRFCYAERIAGRFCGPGLPYEGLATRDKNGHRWTGNVRLVRDELLTPLHWRKRRRVFVCSMSDLFHEETSDDDIDLVFATMLACHVLENISEHSFQVLTKRAERMSAYLSGEPARLLDRWAKAMDGRVIMDNADVCFSEYVYGAVSRRWDENGRGLSDHRPWGFLDQLFPLRNVWLGVSTENQETADQRIPLLLKTPAVVRFVSCEPLLAPIDLGQWVFDREQAIDRAVYGPPKLNRDQADDAIGYSLNWVIAGAESGPGARPMQEAWTRSIKNQCVLANVPFFFKQAMDPKGKKVSLPLLDGARWQQFPRVSRG